MTEDLAIQRFINKSERKFWDKKVQAWKNPKLYFVSGRYS